MTFPGRWILAWPILSLVLLLAAMPAVSQTGSPAKPAKPEEKADTTLAHAVHHQLQEVPFYSVFDYLSFSVDGKKVTLLGQVQRPTLKAQAEAAVKSLEGVAAVVNKIEVEPASAADHELGRNVYRAIFEDHTLQKYAVEAVPPVHIILKNGAVNLEGTVDSEGDKTLAGNLASKVSGVSNLRNNLVVRKK